MVKNLPAMPEIKPACNGFDPWVGKIPWKRKWQPTPVLAYGQNILWTEEHGGLQSMGCKSQTGLSDETTTTNYCGRQPLFKMETKGKSSFIKSYVSTEIPLNRTPWISFFYIFW